MAMTVTISGRFNSRGKKHSFGFFSGDTSYTAGGYAITANALSLYQVDMIMVGQSTGGYTGVYDFINGKIKWLWVDTSVDGAPLSDVAAGTNLSNIITALPFHAIGW